MIFRRRFASSRCAVRSATVDQAVTVVQVCVPRRFRMINLPFLCYIIYYNNTDGDDDGYNTFINRRISRCGFIQIIYKIIRPDGPNCPLPPVLDRCNPRAVGRVLHDTRVSPLIWLTAKKSPFRRLLYVTTFIVMIYERHPRYYDILPLPIFKII